MASSPVWAAAIFWDGVSSGGVSMIRSSFGKTVSASSAASSATTASSVACKSASLQVSVYRDVLQAFCQRILANIEGRALWSEVILRYCVQFSCWNLWYFMFVNKLWIYFTGRSLSCCLRNWSVKLVYLLMLECTFSTSLWPHRWRWWTRYSACSATWSILTWTTPSWR